ncbi:hypothetical protein BRC96_03495 [Halobacteriales archaeon QS_6_64_34]|nr:MAG: hypothetical protein BRC96_03495 [Halobacteriales archaeon QS_6_64_34]
MVADSRRRLAVVALVGLLPWTVLIQSWHTGVLLYLLALASAFSGVVWWCYWPLFAAGETAE